MRYLLFALTLTACAANVLDDGDGRQALRTALYAVTSDANTSVASVVLSNGHFDCTLPDAQDPSAQDEALVDLAAAGCREDARHVMLRFSRPTGTEWPTTYSGVDAFTGEGHEVWGRYYAVIEAELARENGLVREYRVTEDETRELRVGGEGELRTLEDGVLTGSYTHLDEGVSARFAARECDPQDWLFARLATLGRITCELE